MQPYTLRGEEVSIINSLPTHCTKRNGVLFETYFEGNGIFIVFVNAPDEDECRGVQARVLSCFDSYNWSEKTNNIVRDLVSDIENFQMLLAYQEPCMKPTARIGRFRWRCVFQLSPAR